MIGEGTKNLDWARTAGGGYLFVALSSSAEDSDRGVASSKAAPPRFLLTTGPHAHRSPKCFYTGSSAHV
jgi:hypothetical protein